MHSQPELRPELRWESSQRSSNHIAGFVGWAEKEGRKERGM